MLAMVPFYLLRIDNYEVKDAQTWNAFRDAIAASRATCDEIWFDTLGGFPTLANHRRLVESQMKPAEDLRKLGVLPSVEVCTIGHGDGFETGDGLAAVDGWQGWTGSTGVECKECFCPRDPKFIAYCVEMSKIHAAFHPVSFWLDDDLRAANHIPATKGSLIGCWCQRCLADFSARESREWSREALAIAAKQDSALYDRWEAFSFSSLAELARAMALAVKEVSPETIMGYQQGEWRNGAQQAIYKALYEASGKKVGARLGGGAWQDHDPHLQIEKAFGINWQRKCLEPINDILYQVCNETETYPRVFSCRTTHGMMLELMEALALGADSLSFFYMNGDREPLEFYNRRFIRPLADKRFYFERYAKANAGTLPAGLNHTSWIANWYKATAGIPIICGYGVACGDYADFVKANGGKDLDSRVASSSELMQWYQLADQITNGKLPVLPENAINALIVPRITPDRQLKTVLIVNTTIDTMPPLKLRLRGVPANVDRIAWHPLDAATQHLPVKRDGPNAFVTVHSLAAWNVGWLELP